jgi:hypothetical protein
MDDSAPLRRMDVAGNEFSEEREFSRVFPAKTIVNRERMPTFPQACPMQGDRYGYMPVQTAGYTLVSEQGMPQKQGRT